MKKIIAIAGLALTLTLPALTGLSGATKLPLTNGQGMWVGSTATTQCGPNSVCVEWSEPGVALDGLVCCVSAYTYGLPPDIDYCEQVVDGPRPDGADQTPVVQHLSPGPGI